MGDNTGVPKEITEMIAIKELERMMGMDWELKTEMSNAILEFIFKNEEKETQANLLAHLLENFHCVPQIKEKIKGRKISEKKYEQLAKELSLVISAQLSSIVQCNMTSKKAAEKILKLLLAYEKDEQAYILAQILFHEKFVPYFITDSILEIIEFDQEETHKISQKIKKQVMMMKNIVDNNDMDIYKKATLILDILSKLENQEKKKILLIILMVTIEQKNQMQGLIPGLIIRGIMEGFPGFPHFEEQE